MGVRMESNLGRFLPIEPQSVNRTFGGASSLSGATVGDYWRWAYSDLLGNTSRGLLAQFIVAKALGDQREVVDVWASYDVIASDGTTVEVKSAAYLQSWSQTRHSRIRFGIAETWAWDPETGAFTGSRQERQSDVYVFALLGEKDKAKVKPLDLRQWEFYVVSASVLNAELGSAKSISLARLSQMSRSFRVGELAAAVENRAKR
jgi:hypothetical protein